MSRRVVQERVEMMVCDSCRREVDPEKRSIGERWFSVDLRVFGLRYPMPEGLPRDACSPYCLREVLITSARLLAEAAS